MLPSSVAAHPRYRQTATHSAPKEQSHGSLNGHQQHFANALAKQHHLTKKQGREMLEDLIFMITKHLKRRAGEDRRARNFGSA